MVEEGFVKRLKALRKSLNLTQKQFADIAGLSQGNISDIELGKRGFSQEAIISIYRYASDKNISVEWLLTGEGEMKKSTSEQEYESVILQPGQSELIGYYDQLSPFEQGRLVEYARSRITLMEEIAARNFTSTNDERHKPRKVRLSKKADGGASNIEVAAEITPRLPRSGTG
jgi:transcriptional regulator with XRE-family HTH domain